MQALPESLSGEFTLTIEPRHTADALGNVGMAVLGTPYVVWMVEAAAYQAIKPYLEPGEGVAGVHVDCYHTAPAGVGTTATATARLVGRDRARLSYTFTVTAGGTELAHGSYESMVLPFEKLFSRIKKEEG
jgi:fluoroacetyl-CoA thioesterase